jgi:hypothetical protein
VPGEEAAYAEQGEDLYPRDLDAHQRLLTEVLQAFQAADDARSQYLDRWDRYYKLSRSYAKRKKGDWRSKVFVPVSFWIIQTELPRLAANLPKPLVNPIGVEDQEGAQAMEEVLGWATDQSGTYLEFVKATWSALTYGTGILKTFHKQVKRPRLTQVQEAAQPQIVMDPETGGPLLDPDGEPVMASPNGQTPEEDPGTYEVYDGPAAQYVDIANFWPAPEAEDVDGARYCIQRVFRDWRYVLDLVNKGVFRLPENMSENDITPEEPPAAERLASIELGAMPKDPTHKPVELLEFWTDELVITVANRKAILRVQKNPFQHGEIPFVRMVDHLVPGEFWGIGEIEPLEGLQDLLNAIVNQRVDNGRLTMDAMFLVAKGALQDLGSLRVRPGGAVEVDFQAAGAGGLEQAIHRLDLGDVNTSAFSEAAEIERMIEKVTGVTGYQQGTDAPSLNDTATGIALIQEAGATRFAFKNKLAELTAYKRLARQFGSIIQQFWDTERAVRLLGPNGEMIFKTFTPEAIQGAFDYDIEAESSTQTESLRKGAATELMQMMFGLLPPDPFTGGMGPGQRALAEDVLRAYGKKDIERYLGTAMLPQQPIPGMGPTPLPIGPEPTALPEELQPAA